MDERLETYTFKNPEEEIKWLRQCVRELQNERDFYKKRISENTAAMMKAAQTIDNLYYSSRQFEKWLEAEIEKGVFPKCANQSILDRYREMRAGVYNEKRDN